MFYKDEINCILNENFMMSSEDPMLPEIYKECQFNVKFTGRIEH